MTSVEAKAETWMGTEELTQTVLGDTANLLATARMEDILEELDYLCSLNGLQQGVAEGTVELLELLSHVQGGRMEEQRCLFDPKKIPCTPKHTDAANPAPSSGTRSQVVSGSDRDRQEKTAAGTETDHLCNMLSRVQGARMDEQRCSAPQNLLAPGSPAPPRKAHSRPASPTATPSCLGPPRSASLSPPPHKEREQRDGLQTAQQGLEEEQFFSLLSHVQRGCMEEQRCVFDPNKRSTCTPKHTDATDTTHSAADIDQLFSILASTQGRRLDDQRASLNVLPGLQVVSGSAQDGQGRSVAGKETDQLCNMVSRVQGCRIDEQRCFLPVPLSPAPPRSVSMSAVALDDSLPRQGHFLSAPYLSPSRKAQLNPASPSRATPTKARSRPASPSRTTPTKARSRPASPSRATPTRARYRPLSPNTVQHASRPIGPEEDYFSFIHRVHMSQLQLVEGAKEAQGSGGGEREGGGGESDRGRRRERGEGEKREGKKGVEEKERRNKEEVRKEEKGGGRKK